MNLDVLELNRKRIVQRVDGMFAKVKEEDRGDFNEDEQKAYDAEVKSLESINRQVEQARKDQGVNDYIANLTGIPGGAASVTITPQRRSMGQDVVEHKAFKEVIEQAKRSRRFESELIEVKAAPILVDGLVPAESVGQVVPGPMRRLPVAGLFTQGTTGSNSVTYNRQTAFTNAAAAVAEGATKPESEVVLTPIVEQVRKYAHWITVSKEALDDIDGIRSFIDGAVLRYGLAFKIEDALVNGTTVPPSLVGLLNRTGLSATVVQGAAPDTAADAILRQIAAVEVASGLPADGVVMHPSDWTPMIAGKDTQGQYYGNGPFASPTPPTLWGLPVAVTPVIPENTVLVGAFKTGAQLMWREMMAVSVSNSHADYFTKNLVAILIEARLALIVTMPEAFGKVTLVP